MSYPRSYATSNYFKPKNPIFPSCNEVGYLRQLVHTKIFFSGLKDNPLTLKWVNERPVLSIRKDFGGPSLISDRDYESLVLTKMRQAAERQRLIEEMMKEEENS